MFLTLEHSVAEFARSHWKPWAAVHFANLKVQLHGCDEMDMGACTRYVMVNAPDAVKTWPQDMSCKVQDGEH